MRQRGGINNGNYKHGGKGECLYEVWCSMRHRCLNPEDKSYPRYGGRGITVCNDWNSDYALFKNWALAHGYKHGLSLDRIDNDGGYSPENCRWANIKTQNNNKRNTIKITHNGETKSLGEWSETLGIKYDTVYSRYMRGKKDTEILESPNNKNIGSTRTDITIEKLMDLIESSYSMQKMSKILKCSPTTVKNKLILYGLFETYCIKLAEMESGNERD